MNQTQANVQQIPNGAYKETVSIKITLNELTRKLDQLNKKMDKKTN